MLKTLNFGLGDGEMKQRQRNAYVLDLTKISGNGDFSCPKCGSGISPDDTSEECYTILEAKVNSNGLDEVVICCTVCASELHLKGFSILQEESDTD